ncbi:glycosyltransferase involved in cell wall biosynthesis [Pedobacter sp. UYP24]
MVSVCIATYNGGKYLHGQLATILKQLGPFDEIIISDDSSTDDTVEIARSFEDDRIKIFGNQKFKSAIFNFENALKLASNEYIFLSDQDDEWVDGRVSKFLDVLKSHDVVVCDHSLIDENGSLIMGSYFSTIASGPGIFKNFKKNTYYGCCMAFKREVLSLAIPFPKDIPMHDIWLGFVSDLFFKAKFLNFPYTRYRKHQNNVSTATELVSSNGMTKKLSFRWNVVKYLPKLIYRKYSK